MGDFSDPGNSTAFLAADEPPHDAIVRRAVAPVAQRCDSFQRMAQILRNNDELAAVSSAAK